MVRNTSVTVGASIAATIVASGGLTGQFPADTGYTQAFVVSAVGAALLLVAATFLPGRASEAPPPELVLAPGQVERAGL